MRVFEPRRQLGMILDYEFGRGVSRALPKHGFRFLYSRKSGRLKQVVHEGKLFATIRPNGAVALTIYGASLLSRSKAFLKNSVVVESEAVEFVKQGKSVFCKFVKAVGRHVLPGGEVVILDGGGRIIGVGRAKLHGKFMQEFRAGVAVKVRTGAYENEVGR